MIQPDSKLPWKELLNKKKQKYQLYAADNLTCVIENVPSLADAMYIEEACNNYSKAIELLKLIKESETWNEEQYSIDISLNKELAEFLKQIKN